MSQPRPEDYIGLVRSVAAKLRRDSMMFSADLDDLMGDGMEALIHACRAWNGEGSFAGYAAPRLRWRMIDGFRERTHHRAQRTVLPMHDGLASYTGYADGAPDEPSTGGWMSGNTPSNSSAEDEALGPMVVEEALASLPPRLRLVAEASLEPGGQVELARLWGVTESAVSHLRAEAHRRLRRHFERTR